MKYKTFLYCLTCFWFYGVQGKSFRSLQECDLESHLAAQDLTFNADRNAQEAIFVALESTGELVAPPELVDKITLDLLKIRETHEEMNAIVHSSPWIPGEVLVSFTPEAQQQIEDGTYSFTELDNVAGSFGNSNVEMSFGLMVISYDTLYHPERLVEAFLEENIPGVSNVEPNYLVGGSGTIGLEENTDDGVSSSLYRFEIGYGDCFSGCICRDYWIFDVQDGEAVTPTLLESSSSIIPIISLEPPITEGCDLESHLATQDLTFNADRTMQEAILVALESSGELVAPPELVDKITLDLLKIRETHEAMNAIVHSPPWIPGDVIVSFTAEAQQQIEDGTYSFTELDDVAGSFGNSNVKMSASFMAFSYDTPYHPERLVEAFLEENIPGVSNVEPNYLVGGSGTIGLEENTDDGVSSSLYRFEIGYGDCFSGCICRDYWIFDVQDGEAVTPTLLESSASIIPMIPVEPPITEGCDLESHLATQDLTFNADRNAREAILVALESSGELVAPPELVDKITLDLLKIRETHEEMNAIVNSAAWVPGEVLVSFTTEAQQQIEDGTYSFTELDNVAGSFGNSNVEMSSSFMVFGYDTPYHPERLVEAFLEENIPGVSNVEPNYLVGGSGTIRWEENTDDGVSSSLYRFEIGYGDCFSGCICRDYWIFDVQDGEAVQPTLLDSSSTIIPISLAEAMTDPPTIAPSKSMTDPPTITPSKSMTDPPTIAPTEDIIIDSAAVADYRGILSLFSIIVMMTTTTTAVLFL